MELKTSPLTMLSPGGHSKFLGNAWSEYGTIWNKTACWQEGKDACSCKRGSIYLLEIVHCYFPRTQFCWFSSLSTMITYWEASVHRERIIVQAAVADSLLQLHRVVLLNTQMGRTVCKNQYNCLLGFPSPWQTPQLDKVAVRSDQRFLKCADDPTCPIEMEPVRGVQAPEPHCPPSLAFLSLQEQAGHLLVS